MSNVLQYQLPEGFLASRNAAIPHRNQLERAFSDENVSKVYLDLRKVNAISESYADEIFGVLVQEFGLDEVLEKLKINNASDFVIKNIAIVIDRRARASCPS